MAIFIVTEQEEAPIVKRIFEMYLAGNTMADIIRYLNENGVKTSKGNPYNKDSIRRILTSRKYLGIYIYGDIEVANGIPRIISDEMFSEAQVLLEKNKKAPARAKAVEEYYLLTTRLFCGHCRAAMTGLSGTSSTGKKYQYYACVTQRRDGGCNKKPVKKEFIEDLVVEKVLSVLSDEYIETVAQKIADLSVKESNTDTIKRLKKLLKENEAATQNLIKAIESGKAVDVLSTQIERRQAEKADFEIQLAKEKMVRPVLTFEEVKFFFAKFKNGDANDHAYRAALIDAFINKIYLYDGDDARVEIYCNASDQMINCSIDEHSKRSSIEQLATKRARNNGNSNNILVIFIICITNLYIY